MTLTLVDFFCGAGGSSQGAAAVPGVTLRLAANHWDRAIETHARNFPHADHWRGDIHDADAARFPAADLFWASPECPQWSQARGTRRYWDRQPDLFGEVLPDPAADRSRALMWDVPRYLEAVARRGAPVLAGVVENVTEVRQWAHWNEWVTAIRHLGYKTRLIALNSMHARPAATAPAPQSRDRLYLAYWRDSLGRSPDWDKWLRPRAWCPACETEVTAVQCFKRERQDMGRYRQSYLYRCPNLACRNAVVEPPALPAATVIDWADLGTRIGDRARPMRDATRARIAAGLARYAQPITLDIVRTNERRDGVRAWPATAPFTAQTATPTKALACPPLIVPAGGTWRAEPAPATAPFTARENDGLAFPPDAAMIVRNYTPRGDPGQMATPVAEPLRTLTAAGNQSLATWAHLLVPYYGRATIAQPVTLPAGTMPTHDRYGLATGTPAIPVDDVLFRMLKPAEIGRAMAFGTTYIVLGNNREKVRQYGNAVTPPAAEILLSALVEAIAPDQEREAA